MINKDELLFVVDESNQPLPARPREEVHKDEHWHRNSNVWIVNSRGQVLCQQRSFKKDSSPGFWEPFFGGHVLAGDGYKETAIKECGEELGLEMKEEELFFIAVHKIRHTKEFVSVYMMEWNGEVDAIRYEKDEINQLRWIDIGELKKVLIEENGPNWTRSGFEREIIDTLLRKGNNKQ
ncbi:MAG: NUDIX domain-containing protein [Patescibacteria group bacterium]|nr:NUDIX domain-containing protein [Patescibacteria group bacterium]MDE2144587.1 NUDIX domain-containing protein [Patescibacteria group bacterium]